MKTFFYVSEGELKSEKVIFEDIIYVKASSEKQAMLITESKTYFIFLPLKALQKKLPKRNFQLVHPDYLVSIDHVVAIDKELGELSLRSKATGIEDIAIPLGPDFTDNWYKRYSIPGKEKFSDKLITAFLSTFFLQKANNQF
jgi:hypothetical protein